MEVPGGMRRNCTLMREFGNPAAAAPGVLSVALLLLLVSTTLLAAQADFRRGDANADSGIELKLDVSDAIATLGYLFLGIPPSLDCEGAADSDDSGALDITDALYTLYFLFLGDSAPPAPFPDCGPDPTEEGLSCNSFPPCQQLPNQPPSASFTMTPESGETPLAVAFDGSPSTDPDGSIAAYDWDFGDGKTGAGIRVTHTYIRPGTIRVTLKVTDDRGAVGTASADVVITGLALPQDPSEAAPPLDSSVATDLYSATKFLYTGADPIQTGVAPETIDARRVVVLRGRVLNRDGSPLPGVKVTVLGQGELGQTLSRVDGRFDLAVNGGGLLTVQYGKAGYCPAHRTLGTPWREYVQVPDLVLVAMDPVATAVGLGPGTPIQVARGSPQTDERGTRQATVVFPPGTSASLVLPDGGVVPAGALQVRATEFTVGPSGEAAMPAPLPPASAYTYCVDLSADEADAAGAIEVRFDRSLCLYVENFQAFPVGAAVPTGYYDRRRGVWVAAPDGRVVKVLAEAGGLAEIDADGDGSAEGAESLAALGVTEDERRTLASLYEPGQTLWRACVTHFTPWDCNWPYTLPDDAEEPDQSEPEDDDPEDPTCEIERSVIEVQTQTLRESLPVAGTPYALSYSGGRVPGRLAAYTRTFRISDAALPNRLGHILKRIRFEISVAGRTFRARWSRNPPDPPIEANLTYTFTWDGEDAEGRVLQGAQKFRARLYYDYEPVYIPPRLWVSGGGGGGGGGGFGRSSGGAVAGGGPGWNWSQVVPLISDMAIGVFQEWNGSLGTWDARGYGLGGWTLSPHHFYDPESRVLHLGDGRSIGADDLATILNTAAGTGQQGFSGDGGPATKALLTWPHGVALAADGTVYFTDSNNGVVRRIGPDGIISTIAGMPGQWGFAGDGGPATAAKLNRPQGLAVASDGSIYVADTNNHSIRRIRDGTITTIAGSGVQGYLGDGGPATQARLNQPYAVALGIDGAIFIADTFNHSIRQVGTDGIITTVAGDGIQGRSEPGTLALRARLNGPQGLAVGADGSYYIAEYYGSLINKVGPDGRLTRVAGKGGTGSCLGCDDGKLAAETNITSPWGVAVASDGSLYFTEHGSFQVRWIDPQGILRTLAGNGLGGLGQDGVPGRTTPVSAPAGIAVAPNGEAIYIAEIWGNRIRYLGHRLPGFSNADISIVSRDGAEVYQFNPNGRHLRTLDALTGVVLERFEYDGAGRLARIIDRDGNETTVERGPEGRLAIISPFGQRTELAIGGDGFLESARDPAGGTVILEHSSGGLLLRLTDANGGVHPMEYDNLGRLERDSDPAGGFWHLLRVEEPRPERDDPEIHTITAATALGRTTSYRVEKESSGTRRQTITFPSGLKTEWSRDTFDVETLRYADGTVVRSEPGRDPRWGSQAPIPKSVTVTTPGGRIRTSLFERAVTLRNPFDLLSIVTITDVATINGQRWTAVFDGSTRTVVSTSQEGRELTLVLDERGRIVEAGQDGLLPVAFEYDARGRLRALSAGSNAEVRRNTFQYGEDGFLASATDALGRIVTYDPDPVGRTKQLMLPGERNIGFGHDPSGNVTRITPPGKPDHTFAYNEVDRISEYHPPDVNAGADQTLYRYNSDKELRRIICPDGQVVELEYDGGDCTCGRLIGIVLPRGEINYGYSAETGHLTTIAAPGGLILTYEYDGFLLTRESYAGPIAGSVEWQYDTAFRASRVVIGGEAVSYSYDQDDLIVKAGDLALTRSPETGLIAATSLGAVATSITYNDFGELASVSTTHGGAVLYSIDYGREVLSRKTRKVETIGGVTTMFEYGYDDAGRLSEVTRDGLLVSEYAYDLNGNRRSATLGGTTLLGDYDDQDRMSQYGIATYTYTANGYLRTKTTPEGTTTYDYDPLGNLMSVALAGGTLVEYLVDGRDRRIGKQINGALVQGFIYDDQLRPLVELDGAGDLVSRFVYATRINVPDYLVRQGVAYRIITDHLGSPRLVVNAATGEVAQRMDYDEFGKVLQDTSPGFQPFGFAGGIYDRNTGLVRFGARDYDAETGRWTAKDPILFGGGDTNLYGYVLNDPVNLTDVSGLVIACRENCPSTWETLVWSGGMLMAPVTVAVPVAEAAAGAAETAIQFVLNLLIVGVAAEEGRQLMQGMTDEEYEKMRERIRERQKKKQREERDRFKKPPPYDPGPQPPRPNPNRSERSGPCMNR